MKTERIVSFRPLAVLRMGAGLLSLALAAAAVAEVRVDEPWVRATVDGQQASGAFMTLTSTRAAKLVAVQSPVAGIAEIHEMSLENNVMRMRAIDALELPAGTPVVLRPGGYHLMLLDLKAPLQVGKNVPLQLTVENADGTRESIEVQAAVQPLTAGGHRNSSHKHH